LLVLLSPAKSLNLSSSIDCTISTIPIFQEKIEPISKVLKKLSVKQIEKKFDLSNKLAVLNHERFQNLGNVENIKTARQAIFTFDGEVYTGLDAYTIDKKKFEFTQNTVRMLSGLYGVIRPFDLIEPYRLEMGSDIAIGRKKNLYQYWSDDVTALLTMGHETVGHGTMRHASLPILNLASNEYSKVVDRKKLSQPILDVDFLDEEKGVFKNISFFSKKARGLMARYIIDHTIQDFENIKSFDIADYSFNKILSTEAKYVFTRKSKK
jgi:uncharacterized protein